MNFIKRVVALILALLITGTMLPAAYAADNSTTAYAGKSATVSFTVSDIYSLDGVFYLEDPDKIVDSYDCRVADRGGMKGGNVSGRTVYLYDTANPAQPRDVTLEVTVNLKSDAKVNGECTVTFTYQKGTDESGLTVVSGDETAKVTVAVEPNGSTDDDEQKPGNTVTPDEGGDKDTDKESDKDTDKDGDKNTNTNNNSSNNNGSSSGNKNNNSSSGNKTNTNTSTEATEAKDKVDYDKLNKQITIAEGFKEEDYDEEAWDKFSKVLKEAKKLTDSDDQGKVDKAAEELAAAIVELVGVDYSRLREAMDKVADLSQEPELSALWYQMIEVLNNAEALLESTDQAAVDAGAVQIETLIEAIAKAAADTTTQPEDPEQEVPTETEPSEELCNISMHKVWPILFFASLAINIALAVLIVVYVVRRKKNLQDDTPLVDYDIDDDDDLDGLEDFEDDLEGIGAE